MESNYYCQVLYPISITISELYEFGDITEEKWKELTEPDKAELIYNLADYYLTSGSVEPLIIECVEEELND